ncbi:MAG TPA: carboxypeptidase regulatory-like domain-containing protein [Bryobacteraceae bacterium]|nr:carboxypeptidase regulatory-like domain-containing protein [Bryobacteraceae bacterium]
MRKLITYSAMFIAVSASILFAQGSGVSGRVTDASGATMPNARIELENVDTGQRITATSDTNGSFQVSDIPAGRYRIITSSTSSSRTTPGQEITVDASRSATINIVIPSGPGTDVVPQTETVNVTSKPSSVQNVWNTRFIHYLPTTNFVDRNGNAFGAYNLGALSEASNGAVLGWPGGPAIGGSRPNTNLFHVDGIDNNNLLNGGGPLVYVSNEATNEFALFQNQPQPVFGHSGGAKFNSIVRSGTNRVHGSVYNYLQNRNLNAIDRTLASRGYNDSLKYDQNRMGGTLGIPVIPSKMFFFGSFEYIPLSMDRPTGGLQFAPTAAGFNTLAGLRGVSAANLALLRSATGGTVSASAGDTSVLNNNIGLGLVNNVSRYRQDQIAATGSIDWTFTDRDQLRFRYSHHENDAMFSGFGLSSFQTPRWNRAFVASAAHYHNFANAVTNELRFGYTRNNSEQYGLTNDPAIFIGQGFNLGLGQQRVPTGVTNTYHLADAVSFTMGGHNLRLGFDGRRFIGSRANFAQSTGVYGYSTLERFLVDLSPDVYAQRAFGNTSFNLGQWNYFGYVHDTWQVVPGFTLELGGRWQHSSVPVGLQFQGMNADAGFGDVAFNEPARQSRNFAPYGGFAWMPAFGRNTVVRGGFGMYYDAMNQTPILFGFAPMQTRVLQGNLLANSLNFLANGGIQDPAVFNAGTASIAQQRAATSALIGNQRLPYSMQWNVAVQQSVWNGATLEVKYLSNRGFRLPVFGQLNAQGVTEQRSLPVYTDRPTQAQLNGLPFTLGQLQQPQANAFTAAGFTNPINTVNYDGRSWYNAAAVTLQHNFTGGLQMFANYTWSRFEDDATGTPLDIGLPSRQRTWSMFDRRHAANVTAMFEVAPLFRNTYSVVRNVFADFNLAGTYRYSTGSTLIPVSGLNTGFNNNPFGTRALVNVNATGSDVTGLAPLTNSQGAIVAYQTTNPNARFIQGAAGVYAGGNRGGMMLPDIHNFDVAAVKRFNFRESASFELRGEAYNVLNRRNTSAGSLHGIGWPDMASTNAFAIPGTVNLADVNRLDAVLPSNNRILQLALRLVF